LSRVAFSANSRLNALCPYYTMYPLDFPLRVLQRRAKRGQWVLDPFCGRGTTNFAARLLGLNTLGIDSSPIAVAISAAKLASVTSAEIVATTKAIISTPRDKEIDVPEGEFWRWAFHESTLHDLCRLRRAIGPEPNDAARIVLRALILGILHGPKNKRAPTYLSNQAPRTFAPKPDYAVSFWQARGLRPPAVDVVEAVRRRAEHCLTLVPQAVQGEIIRADSRAALTYREVQGISWVITSPPYFGMRTYIADQWLRNWFVGGPPYVPYGQPTTEIAHRSQEIFAEQLHSVWRHVALSCKPGARLVCRFGGINDRKADPLVLLRRSFAGSGWRPLVVRAAGRASDGRRQAAQFGERGHSQPLQEYDVYAILE
jgi:DNA methylase